MNGECAVGATLLSPGFDDILVVSESEDGAAEILEIFATHLHAQPPRCALVLISTSTQCGGRSAGPASDLRKTPAGEVLCVLPKDTPPGDAARRRVLNQTVTDRIQGVPAITIASMHLSRFCVLLPYCAMQSAIDCGGSTS